jgi:sensor histidine kinase regulating citrate/malate metabolism
VHFSNSFIEILQNAQAAMVGNEEKILTVSVQSQGGCIVVAIGDNGCGMDEQTRRKAVDMLEHPAESADAHLSGFASVACMLQPYKPSYRVESSPGNTMVRVSFPVPEETD